MSERINALKVDNRGETTQTTVYRFIKALRRTDPTVDVMTMSSTHLPWLKPFFVTAAHISAGAGHTHYVATATAEFSLEKFNAALHILGAPCRAKEIILP